MNPAFLLLRLFVAPDFGHSEFSRQHLRNQSCLSSFIPPIILALLGLAAVPQCILFSEASLPIYLFVTFAAVKER